MFVEGFYLVKTISLHRVVSRGDGLPYCLLTRFFLVDYQWRFIQTWRRETVFFLTDSSKAIHLLWIFYVFLSCVCYAFVRASNF